MRRFLACALLLTQLTLWGEEKESPLSTPTPQVENRYFYWDLGGLPPFFPMVGTGWRMQRGHMGYDLSLHGSIISFGAFIPITGAFRENLSLLNYPFPCLKGQFYWGGGVSAAQDLGYAPRRRVFYIGPNALLGYSYQNKKGRERFWQGNIDLYLLQKKHHIRGAPFPTFSYGMRF